MIDDLSSSSTVEVLLPHHRTNRIFVIHLKKAGEVCIPSAATKCDACFHHAMQLPDIIQFKYFDYILCVEYQNRHTQKIFVHVKNKPGPHN